MIAILQFTNELFRKVRIEDNGMIGLFKHETSGLGTNFPKEQVALYYSESELQQKIESAVAEHDQATQDTLQAYYDNDQQLLEQIEELKSKVRPPVELNKAYCDELDRLLENYGPITILHKVIKGDIDLGLIHSLDLGYLVQALTDGYTVKPKITLQERMENLLKSPEYHGLDFEMVAKEMAIVLKHEGWIKDEEA